MRGTRWCIAAAVACCLAAGCDDSAPPPGGGPLDDEAVTIGSFDFVESTIVAELYGQALEGRGVGVVRALDLGPRELVEPALERGLIELVPEYLGTSLEFLNRGAGEATSDPESTLDALREELDGRGLVALRPAPAQDANALVVAEGTAEHYGLHTISDLAPVAEDLVLGGPAECPDRPLCLRGLERVYGLRFERFVPLDAGGPLTVEALALGEIDVAVLFTTSGYIAEGDVVVLDDDRGLQPAENLVPVARAELVRRFGPPFTAALDDVSRVLSTAGLIDLNRRVGLEGADAGVVATEWLHMHGVVDSEAAAGGEGS